MARTRYRIYDNGYPHVITCTTVAWLPVFSQPAFAEIVLDSWRFLQRDRGIEIFAWVIMENHLHWIAKGDDLDVQIGRFKSFTARRLIDAMKERGFETLLEELRFFKLRHKIDQEYQLWQEGSHPQQIDNDLMMEQKVDYTHFNPVRRGYVDFPEHWRYSSARNYLGKKGLIGVVTDWR